MDNVFLSEEQKKKANDDRKKAKQKKKEEKRKKDAAKKNAPVQFTGGLSILNNLAPKPEGNFLNFSGEFDHFDSGSAVLIFYFSINWVYR